jgi:Uma2 family endonuclease
MTQVETRRATYDDLLRFEGKAELIDGRIVERPMAGDRPGTVAVNIGMALIAFARAVRKGKAHVEVDYGIRKLRSGRESFRPDASYYVGSPPENPDDVIPGPPTLAVEMRSKEDYGPAAECALAAKRAEYFEAGTPVVWDVNPRQETITVYRRAEPESPKVYRRGEIAEAEPAAPGFTMPVDDAFGS